MWTTAQRSFSASSSAVLPRLRGDRLLCGRGTRAAQELYLLLLLASDGITGYCDPPLSDDHVAVDDCLPCLKRRDSHSPLENHGLESPRQHVLDGEAENVVEG